MIIKYIYEVGIIFRGFILISHEFRELPAQTSQKKDLRAAFVSAIASFAETAFNDNSLEYLESGNLLFIFKMGRIKPADSNREESVILYGLTEKKKKNPNKFVNKFLQKTQILLESFIYKYANDNFSELSKFAPFKEEIKKYFIS